MSDISGNPQTLPAIVNANQQLSVKPAFSRSLLDDELAAMSDSYPPPRRQNRERQP
jgi:hypothetical protein